MDPVTSNWPTRWQKVAGTGHRKLRKAEAEWVRTSLITRVLPKLVVQYGTETVLTGMADGFDMDWAEVAAYFYRLRLHALIPHPAQAEDHRWSQRDRDRWADLRKIADAETMATRQVPDGYGEINSAMRRRNWALVAQGTALVACWKQGRDVGGTFRTITRAVEKRRPIIWLDPEAQTIKLPHWAAWGRILTTTSTDPKPRATTPAS